MDSLLLAKKMEDLEHALNELKSAIQPGAKKVVSIAGLWKSIEISETDIADSEKSLFHSLR
ncbi:MAG: hypothetical protein Q8P05_04225 [Candidatus Diapherotrites archaeon]|nr:hypothetical protein [Candidatus Diapherotrites archaeon]MDZ4256618.1 hypothetical protein [archaeon]